MSGLRTICRRWWAVLPALSLALAIGPRPAPAAAPAPQPWRVLLLYGSPSDNPAAAAATAALRSALSAGAAPRLVDVQSEVQDTLGLDGVDHEAEYLALLRKKTSLGRVDLLMPIGEAALRFTRRHRDELWPGVPIVSLGVPESVLREEASDGNITGVAFDLDEAGTLRLARRLQPDAERLVLIAGSSENDRSSWPRLEAVAAREGDGLEVERLLGQPLSVVLDRVSRLSRRSIVLYTTIFRDADGQTFTPANVAELLAKVSPAPVYTVWESQLGRGVVGGSMESLAAHGRRAADLALRVLRGTSPGTVPVAEPAEPVPLVDWLQMQRFGLPDSALPPGTVVLYRPPSFVKEHRGLVAAVGVTLALQTALILALLVQARARRKAEAEAARQRAELAHAARLSAVGELTASIAHEINQPLGAILSNAEAGELFLDEDPPRLERVRQILSDIQEEDRRASEVIREVRALSRKQPLESEPVDLNDVVRDVTGLVRADARRRNVELQVSLGAAMPLVNGDRNQLRQVLLNLAINSIDALGPGGTGERLVRIRTAASGTGIDLTVSDTGPGLDEAQLAHMFESFFTTKEEGLGLGLSIVRSIVETHGGRVTAENNIGRGAKFRVHLPAMRRWEEGGARAVGSAHGDSGVLAMHSEPPAARKTVPAVPALREGSGVSRRQGTG